MIETLIVAANGGDLDTVRSCIEQGVNSNARNASGDVAMYFAAGKGSVDVINYLLKRGGEVDPESHNRSELWGETPLMYAVRNKRKEAIKVLIENGASILHEAKDKSSPLSLASANGLAPYLKQCLDGLKPTTADEKSAAAAAARAVSVAVKSPSSSSSDGSSSSKKAAVSPSSSDSKDSSTAKTAKKSTKKSGTKQ